VRDSASSIDKRFAVHKQISDDEDILSTLSFVKNLKDNSPDRKLQHKWDIISVISKHNSFFFPPSLAVNPYLPPTTNLYHRKT